MQLTGKQIVSREIITNYCEEGVQQQGIDVRLEEVYMLQDTPGFVPAKGKTQIPETYSASDLLMWDENNCITLFPGYYEIELKESCNIPRDATLAFKTRSSLVRCGAIVHSGQFDGGFNTDHMGCFLEVIRPIKIERRARIAQAIVNESYSVDQGDLYNGQWQGDNQRKKENQ